MPRIFAFLLVVALASGCRHAPPAAPDTGASSFTVVQPPPAPSTNAGNVEAAPSGGGQYREAFLAAKPVLPVYPSRALAAKAGAAQVGVRVTIDTKGRVSGVSTSMIAVSILPSGFADDFRDAVEVAVRQWKFQPARVEYVETVSEGGVTFERVNRAEVLDTGLDLAFTFTATGTVQAGGK